MTHLIRTQTLHLPHTSIHQLECFSPCNANGLQNGHVVYTDLKVNNFVPHVKCQKYAKMVTVDIYIIYLLLPKVGYHINFAVM